MLLQHKIRIYDHLIIDNFGQIYSMRTSAHMLELDLEEARMALKQI